ncbi:MAG: PLDc N-terminal domain-containing protein, partial [Phycisphaerae bacterium]|nr:PLDc N-terminal domain-containing protein [Phycisphaerae bacterium]
LLIVVTNILLTVWVCRDMREQKIGRALWVPITLLAGVFGAIVYAIARNADIRQGRGK